MRLEELSARREAHGVMGVQADAGGVCPHPAAATAPKQAGAAGLADLALARLLPRLLQGAPVAHLLAACNVHGCTQVLRSSPSINLLPCLASGFHLLSDILFHVWSTVPRAGRHCLWLLRALSSW